MAVSPTRDGAATGADCTTRATNDDTGKVKMMNLTTYADLRDRFNEHDRPLIEAHYGKDDGPALREAWNNYTDGACKDGELTALEYHYCPSIDDDDTATWPDDDDGMLQYLADQLSLMVDVIPVTHRPDGLLEDMAQHYHVKITRGDRGMECYFSTGSAHRVPTETDVLGSILTDVDGELDDFTDWCANMGMDDDSIRALRCFEACQQHQREITALVGADNLESLIERAREL